MLQACGLGSRSHTNFAEAPPRVGRAPRQTLQEPWDVSLKTARTEDLEACPLPTSRSRTKPQSSSVRGGKRRSDPQGVGANFSPRLRRDQSIAPTDVRSPYGPTPDLDTHRSELRTSKIWTRTKPAAPRGADSPSWLPRDLDTARSGHARNLRRPTAAQTPLIGLSRAAAAEAPNPTFEQRFGHTLNDERVSPDALENTAPTAPRLGPGLVPPALSGAFNLLITYYLLLPLPPWRSSSPEPHNAALAGADPTGPETAAQNRSRASPPSGTSQIVCVHKRRPRVRLPATRHKRVEHAYQILVCVLKFLRSQNSKCLAGR